MLKETVRYSQLFTLLSAMIILSGCEDNDPKILIKTEPGDIVVELYQKQAPITVFNFLKYVTDKRFEGASFYRVVRMDNQPDDSVRIEVIQGGLFKDSYPGMLPPIAHETTKKTGILHKDGVISMARLAPGTATSEFFICIGDQPELDYGGERNPDGQGFAAFGKVIGGMEVVREIQSQYTDGQYLTPQIKIISIVHME